MRPLDWIVLAGSLTFIVAYGLWRGRGSNTTNAYLLAGKTMPWYAMALSIMATQASAITFISTTGQAYADGMRFVQFYFGLPLAMILISAIAVPIFHGSGVYTAYEYLERRFDARVRALVSVIFLIQRGLAVGIALYAPAVVLTVILGWPDQLTTFLMGVLVVSYTVYGGIKAVTWTDFQQMIVMMAGLVAALATAFWLMPPGVSPLDALNIAGAAGRLNPVVWSFNPDDRYNVWSGLIGGMFLALAYFGCDQSQVQRYLTGRSIAQSRISLLFNAVAKIPMQFLILLTGAVVFVFYIYERPPILFEPADLKRVSARADFAGVEQRYNEAFERRRAAASEVARNAASHEPLRAAQKDFDAARREAAALTGNKAYNDTNYIFLTFVTRYLPAGIVGLVLAAIFAAAMSTISAEINSLATVSVIDVYQRHFRKDASDRHYLRVSQIATAFWGLYAVVTAQYGKNLGSLIEAVNMLGSLFYGGLLGVFALAFLFPRVTAAGAFYGVLLGEAAIFAAWYTTKISFLWYNVIGPLVVISAALAITWLRPARSATPSR
ncbi:MAG TPA: sodium:solute symporter [Solibacterales bacterium]|nr:sodium:solute symporter [Bryobacterales bacterium]